MSRFDRRLKGTGLRPGQSTCKIGKERSGSSPNIGQYATMSWTGNVVNVNRTPTYNPNVLPQVGQQQRQPQQQQFSAPAQSQQYNSVANNTQRMNNVPMSNGTPTVRVMDENKLDYETRMRDLDALAVKNARLEEAEKTAPNQAMRLITRHEIRINTLEALTLKMEHLEMIQNGCARMNSLDDRMIEDLKNDLWSQLKSRHDVEVQTKMMALQDEVVDLKMKLEQLTQGKSVSGVLEEPYVKKPGEITLNIEETSDRPKGGDEESSEESIKNVVAQAIAQVEAGEA